MNTQYNLFPETMLVEIVDGQPVTTSLKVAESFGRSHKDILKVIRRVLDDTVNNEHRRNFAPMSGIDYRNRKRDYYLLTEAGFAIVAMSLTGKTALEWKWRFFEAFEAMRRALAEREARFSRALDVVRPMLRLVTEATEEGQNRAQIGEASGKSADAITYHRRRARDLGLLPERKAA